jgi:2-dehydro-3-deoxyphosphogluconate aldolase/(4S)-4-hydroxy-2-oxoglutarate aldolase
LHFYGSPIGKDSMHKSEVLESIRNCGIVPAIRVNTETQALRAMEALCNGGVQIAEVTMSSPGAADMLDAVIARFGQNMVIGAGTVLDSETARHCILAGAQFIVTPALSAPTIELCRRYSIAVLPGALTPTEILVAWEAGADCVKVFPASAAGGAAYIRGVKAPLPHIELMPMGGVSLATAAEYIKAGSFALGVGNDLVNLSDLGEHGGAEISIRANAYRACVEEARAAQLAEP